MRSIGFPEVLLIPIIGIVIIVVPCWRIAERAGYLGWLGALACIPIVNVVALWWFASAEWPALRHR